MKVVAYMSTQSFEKKVSSSSNMLHNTWKKDHNGLPSPFSAIGPPSSFCTLGWCFHCALLITLSFCRVIPLSSSCSSSHCHFACWLHCFHSTFSLPLAVHIQFCIFIMHVCFVIFILHLIYHHLFMFFFVVILSVVAFVRAVRVC
jgi:hypothetical protein